MAWTAPMTAAANATFTAAQWNQYVRDNMLETEGNKGLTRGRYFVTLAANSIAERSWYVNSNSKALSTTSTSYADLSTVGPTVSNTTGTSAIVFWSCMMGSTTAGAQAWCSVKVSGATTVAASDTWATMVDGMAASTSTDNLIRMSGFHRFTSLTGGVNSFTMQYKVSAGTGWFSNKAISVMSF